MAVQHDAATLPHVALGQFFESVSAHGGENDFHRPAPVLHDSNRRIDIGLVHQDLVVKIEALSSWLEHPFRQPRSRLIFGNSELQGHLIRFRAPQESNEK